MNPNENNESGLPPGPTTSPADAAPTAVAAAVQETVQPAAAPAAPAEPTFTVSGPVFFNICQYVGSKPLRQVITLRQGLWTIQKEQNCVNPQQLPEKVWLTQTAVSVLMEFLATSPCDEVYDLLSAFEREIQAFVQAAQEQAKQAAAAKALADAAATAPAETPVVTVVDEAGVVAPVVESNIPPVDAAVADAAT
jgi:hypothetical protein